MRPSTSRPSSPMLTFRPPRPTFRPQPPRPALNSDPNIALRQLKDQRKLLNDLLQELQKPATNGSGSQPPAAIAPSSPDGGVMPNISALMQAQQALMGIMRNITPMINALGQSGAITGPRIAQSKSQLLEILNSVNNRDLDDDEDQDGGDVDEKRQTKERRHVTKVANALGTVLDGIIEEAETGFPLVVRHSTNKHQQATFLSSTQKQNKK